MHKDNRMQYNSSAQAEHMHKKNPFLLKKRRTYYKYTVTTSGKGNNSLPEIEIYFSKRKEKDENQK